MALSTPINKEFDDLTADRKAIVSARTLTHNNMLFVLSKVSFVGPLQAARREDGSIVGSQYIMLVIVDGSNIPVQGLRPDLEAFRTKLLTALENCK
jgi:hypothetical protein